MRLKVLVRDATEGVDVAIIEIGGTAGDSIESLPFLEAVRQMKIELCKQNALNIHVTSNTLSQEIYIIIYHDCWRRQGLNHAVFQCHQPHHCLTDCIHKMLHHAAGKSSVLALAHLHLRKFNAFANAATAVWLIFSIYTRC